MPSRFEAKNFASADAGLKFAEVITGAICLGLVGYYIAHAFKGILVVTMDSDIFFFLLVAFAFLVSTFLLLISYPSDAEKLQKTFFEILHSLFAFMFYFAAGIRILISISHASKIEEHYNSFIAAGVLALINSGFYIVSIFLSFRNFKAG